jgi:hypothetical protein
VQRRKQIFKLPLIRAAEASQTQGSARIIRNISNLGNVSAP